MGAQGVALDRGGGKEGMDGDGLMEMAILVMKTYETLMYEYSVGLKDY